MTRMEIVTAWLDRTEITLQGVRGIISSLEHEDGSGWSFNVTIQDLDHHCTRTLYVRCSDKPPAAPTRSFFTNPDNYPAPVAERTLPTRRPLPDKDTQW